MAAAKPAIRRVTRSGGGLRHASSRLSHGPPPRCGCPCRLRPRAGRTAPQLSCFTRLAGGHPCPGVRELGGRARAARAGHFRRWRLRHGCPRLPCACDAWPLKARRAACREGRRLGWAALLLAGSILVPVLHPSIRQQRLGAPQRSGRRRAEHSLQARGRRQCCPNRRDHRGEPSLRVVRAARTTPGVLAPCPGPRASSRGIGVGAPALAVRMPGRGVHRAAVPLLRAAVPAALPPPTL